MSDIKGQIVRVKNNIIRGWAYSESSDEPLRVDLYVNDVLRVSKISNDFRPGLLNNDKHETGNVGFRFHLKENPLKNGDVIKLLCKDEVLNIQNCPYVYNTEDKRILVVGLPKSGTSVCTYRIKDAMPEYCKLHFEPEGRKGLNKFMMHFDITLDPCVVTKNLYTIGEKRIKLQRIQNLYDKKIWIYRDPRDLLISTFFYKWNFSHKPDKQEFKKSLAAVKKKEKKPDTLPFHKVMFTGRPDKGIERKYKAILEEKETLDRDWYFLKYEDLVDGKVDDLEKYLGFKIKKDSSVAAHLKRVERSKTYGSWRSWFTDEDVAFFRPIINPIMKKMGYDTNDWKLSYPETLPANEGSEYMSKLFHGGFRPSENILSKLFNFK